MAKLITTTIPTTTKRADQSEDITGVLSRISVDGKVYLVRDEDLDTVISNLNTLAGQVSTINDGLGESFATDGSISGTGLSSSGDITAAGKVSSATLETSGDASIGGALDVDGIITADEDNVSTINASKVTGHTVSEDVPEGAEFTDAKVTSVDNHYVPSGGTTTSASNGTLTDITNSTAGVQVVTGVTKDNAGHVTGVTSVALKSVDTTYSQATSSNLGLVKLSTTSTTNLDDTVLSSSATLTAINSAVTNSVSAAFEYVGSVKSIEEMNKITDTNFYIISDGEVTVADTQEANYRQVHKGNIINVWSNAESESDGMSYAWTGSEWDALGIITDISGKQDTSTAVKHTEDTAIGNSKTGVYVDKDGNVTAMEYSVNATVPADAVFTNTGHLATVSSNTLVLTSVAPVVEQQGEQQS